MCEQLARDFVQHCAAFPPADAARRYCLAAAAFLDKGKPEGALVLVTAAQSLPVTNLQAQGLAALAHSVLGHHRHAGALADAYVAAHYGTDRLAATRSMTGVLCAAGRHALAADRLYREASAYYKQPEAQPAAAAAALCEAGDVYQTMGDAQLSRRAFKKAVKVHNNRAGAVDPACAQRALRGLARACGDLGQAEQAAELFLLADLVSHKPV